jgi:hypothetical protein
MDRREKTVYLEAIRRRYRKANREGKQKILDEFCSICDYNRKYAIRRLNEKWQKKGSRKKKPGKRSCYADQAVLKPLRIIWLATDQLASKRLKEALALWLPHYEAQYGGLSEEVRSKVWRISAATIDRILAV